MAAIVYLTIILLQTHDGTIRIETNGELGGSVPLVIKQGDKVVDRLTVDHDGASTRVRAGAYSIEFEEEGTSFELANNQATVKAGGVWTTKIEYQRGGDSVNTSSDPNAVRTLAIDDARHGRYDAALEKTLWYWDNAVKIQPSLSAVRRSFLLSDWLSLGESYPPALEKLKAIRDDLEDRILSNDQVRVCADDFADFAVINQTLRQDVRTIQLFKKIEERSPQDAERLRFWVPKNRPAPGSTLTPITPTPPATPTFFYRESDTKIWDNILRRCPVNGTAVLCFDHDRSRAESSGVVEQFVKEAGASYFPMNLDVDAPIYVLVKDRILVAVAHAPLTEKNILDFIASANPFLTPTQANVDPRSVVRLIATSMSPTGVVGQ